jgi:hypothetical protein
MEHGKDPLVSPSAEWVQEYKSGVVRHHTRSSSSSHSSSSIIRRRHRRRISPQTKYSRLRVVKMIVVCSALFAIMAVSLYWFLTRAEIRNGEESALPVPSLAIA